MKKTKGQIRKEIKYSTEEWNKVTALAKKIADFLANIDKNKYHTVNNAIKTILFSVINDTDSKSSITTSRVYKDNKLCQGFYCARCYNIYEIYPK